MIIEVAWQVNGVAAKIFLGAEDLSNFLSLARGFSDSTVDCEIRLNYRGRDGDLGEEEELEKWASAKMPPLHPRPWCTQVNVCARVVHLNICPRNHRRDLVETRQ